MVAIQKQEVVLIANIPLMIVNARRRKRRWPIGFTLIYRSLLSILLENFNFYMQLLSVYEDENFFIESISIMIRSLFFYRHT